MSYLEKARSVLKTRFSHSEFRPGQEDIIDAILSKRDVLGVLPTGAGKSVCYQIPAVMVRNATIVVSPLVALMKDQADSLNKRGVQASVLHSGMGQGELNNTIYEASQRRVRVLFVAPERLENRSFRQLLRDISISLVVVDEAHCISEWGHDFRPAYQNIPQIFEHIPRTPILALTATATPDVRADIRDRLGLINCVEIVRGFDRPNLTFKVEENPNKAEFVSRAFYSQPSGALIVYAGTRRKVDTLYEEFRNRGLPALAYHAGMDSGKRTRAQEEFISAESPLLVATNAFGMGIDRSDVRNVIHTDLTLTLESYYQEAGRAGRDGEPSNCTLLYTNRDQQLIRYFIDCANPSISTINEVYQYLNQRSNITIGGMASAPVQADATTIAGHLKHPIPVVQTVLTTLTKAGVAVELNERGLARVVVRTTRERIAEFESNASVGRQRIIRAMMRTLPPSVFSNVVEFSVDSFLRENGFSQKEFSDVIASMHVARLIKFTAQAKGSSVSLLKPRVANILEYVVTDGISLRKQRAEEKFGAVLRYVRTPQCKRNFILEYFSDPEFSGDCGKCSSCKPLHKAPSKQPSARSITVRLAVVGVVAEVNGRFGRNVVASVLLGTDSPQVKRYGLHVSKVWGACRKFTRSEVIRELDAMIQEGDLILTADRFPVLRLPDAVLETLTISQIPVHHAKSEHSTAETMSVRNALRLSLNEIAVDLGQPVSALLDEAEIRSISHDKPRRVADLVVGKHGNGLFLARYGQKIVSSIVSALDEADTVENRFELDDEVRVVIEAIRPHRNLDEVARVAGMSKANTARVVQKAIEQGVKIDLGLLVSTDLLESVLDYLRFNHYARLRQVHENVTSTADLPELRVAVAIARSMLG